MEDIMNNEEEFLLKWNNHQTNLIGVFKEWLMDESFVDVTLVCGGEAVSGHKVVLAACSPLLNRILHDNPCRHPVVILNDVCSTDMKALLKFIYQGEVSVSQSELTSFLRTADNLQIKGLAEDREKDDKKRKEREDTTRVVKKKRKSDTYHISSSNPHTVVHTVNSDSVVVSSLKSQALPKDKYNTSTTNSHRLSSGGHFPDIANSQMLTSSDLGEPFLQDEYSKSCNQATQKEETIVKTEPPDYPVEMVWQEGASTVKREDISQEDCLTAVANTNNCNSSIHSFGNSTTTIMSFGSLGSALEGVSSNSTANFLHKNLESFQQVEGKKAEEDGKIITFGSENQLSQANIIATCDEGADEEVLNSGGSPGKFRGGRKPCCFCGKTFCDNYTLRRHMVTHLSRQRQFECSLCSAAYSRKDHLMAHMRRKHSRDECCDIDPGSKTS